MICGLSFKVFMVKVLTNVNSCVVFFLIFGESVIFDLLL